MSVGIEEAEARRSVRSHLHHNPVLPIRIRKRDAGDARASPANPYPLTALAHSQPGKLIILVVHTRKLQHLARAILVERQAAAGVHHLTLLVLLAPEDQPAVLRPFIVVKDHARLRSPPSHLRML